MYASLTPERPTNACDAYIAVGQWGEVREMLRYCLPLTSQFWDKYTAIWVILDSL